MWRRMSGVVSGGKNYVVCTTARGVGKFASMLFKADSHGEVKDWASGRVLEEFTGERAAEIGHERVSKDAEKIAKEAMAI